MLGREIFHLRPRFWVRLLKFGRFNLFFSFWLTLLDNHLVLLLLRFFLGKFVEVQSIIETSHFLCDRLGTRVVFVLCELAKLCSGLVKLVLHGKQVTVPIFLEKVHVYAQRTQS